MLKLKKKIITVFYVAITIFFSVVSILLNKWLYISIEFPNITLSMIHFIITFVGLIVCEKLDILCVKDIDVREILLISTVFCQSVILTNLSLAYNTVATYQVVKMLTTPLTIIMQMLFCQKHFSILIKLALIPILLGGLINFYYDVQFNIVGTIYATLGVFMTALHEVLINKKQKEFQMDPMQLLYYHAPLSAIVLFIALPIVEPLGQTLTHSWSLWDIFLVILSGIIAFLTNLTSYWVIGQTSPITYNMIGHSKFCFLLLGGAIIFHETLVINQVIGMTVTLIGIILYVHIKIKDSYSTVARLTSSQHVAI